MRLAFLLERGRPPRLNPVFVELFALLEARGAALTLLYAEEELVRLDTLAVEADLYLLKSDTELALSLAVALESLGARVLNPASSSSVVRDKVLTAAALLGAGIPVPRSLVAARPAQLTPELARGPLILKPHRGYHGVGLAVAETPATLPRAECYPDMGLRLEAIALSARGDPLFVRVVADAAERQPRRV